MSDYNPLISEIIKKQSVVLGPQIALSRARTIDGLKVDDEGNVLDLGGNGEEKLRTLIEVYVALSGEIVKNTIEPLIKKYPGINFPA